MAETATAAKLKVFLSYSRKDGAFAEELLSGLELCGFDAYLDKQDIAPGEPWEDRLGALIRTADTVVFVISPNSLASKHCSWEVEETARVAKRLVPVILKVVPDDQVPERLRRLNYVFFSEGNSFAKSLAELVRALRADIGWIREHTRLGELSGRWSERGKPAALLLRGSDLEDARRWAAERPKDAPEVSALQQAFIEASTKNDAEEQEAKARLRWRVQAGLVVATLALGALSIVSIGQWRLADQANTRLEATVGELKIAQASLTSAKQSLEVQNAALAEQNVKLGRKLSLRIAPLGDHAYDVGSGWYKAATEYSGAVAFVQNIQSGMLAASGAIVDGRRLNPAWPARPVFVTASYVISEGQDETVAGGRNRLGPNVVTRVSGEFQTLTPAEVRLVFLGPAGERETVALGKVLWRSRRIGISVVEIAGALPIGSAVIERFVTDVTALADMGPLINREAFADLHARSELLAVRHFRSVISVGNREGRNEITLSIGHLLGAMIPRSEASERVNDTDLVYTKSALSGSAGSPVFDVETGDLVGIHLLASRNCPAEQSGIDRAYQQCTALGTSLPRIIAAIRADPQGR